MEEAEGGKRTTRKIITSSWMNLSLFMKKGNLAQHTCPITVARDSGSFDVSGK
jgi:hypothetical protein